MSITPAAGLTFGGGGGKAAWHRPRFEAAGKPPLLLRDYADYGSAYEDDPGIVLER